MEERLQQTGIIEVLHSVFPPSKPDVKLSDADKATVLPKLLSHARLHLLYVAERLQEHLISTEVQRTNPTSKVCLLQHDSISSL